MATISSVQAQNLAPAQPIFGLHPFNLNGSIGLYVPGELTLDDHAQHMYNDFVYDVPLPSESGQLYLVTVGH